TYTQGFFGSKNGKACVPEGDNPLAVQLIQRSIQNMGGTLTLGRPGKSFTVTESQAAKLNAMMPGGGTAYVLKGAYTVTAVPLKGGRIDNILLSQAITLKLNMYLSIDATLKFLELKETGYFATQSVAKGSDCSNLIQGDCSKGNTISSTRMP